jgi:hypothetical protein
MSNNTANSDTKNEKSTPTTSTDNVTKTTEATAASKALDEEKQMKKIKREARLQKAKELKDHLLKKRGLEIDEALKNAIGDGVCSTDEGPDDPNNPAPAAYCTEPTKKRQPSQSPAAIAARAAKAEKDKYYQQLYARYDGKRTVTRFAGKDFAVRKILAQVEAHPDHNVEIDLNEMKVYSKAGKLPDGKVLIKVTPINTESVFLSPEEREEMLRAGEDDRVDIVPRNKWFKMDDDDDVTDVDAVDEDLECAICKRNLGENVQRKQCLSCPTKTTRRDFCMRCCHTCPEENCKKCAYAWKVNMCVRKGHPLSTVLRSGVRSDTDSNPDIHTSDEESEEEIENENTKRASTELEASRAAIKTKSEDAKRRARYLKSKGVRNLYGRFGVTRDLALTHSSDNASKSSSSSSSSSSKAPQQPATTTTTTTTKTATTAISMAPIHAYGVSHSSCGCSGSLLCPTHYESKHKQPAKAASKVCGPAAVCTCILHTAMRRHADVAAVLKKQEQTVTTTTTTTTDSESATTTTTTTTAMKRSASKAGPSVDRPSKKAKLSGGDTGRKGIG